MLIGAPQLHHWHHDRYRDTGNYANISPLMDLLFGTYVCPDHEPEELGIREEFPKDYIGQLLYPFWPSLYRRWFMQPTTSAASNVSRAEAVTCG